MPVLFNRKSEEVTGSTLDLIDAHLKSKCSWAFPFPAWRSRAGAAFLLLLGLLLVVTFALIVQSSRAKTYWDQLHESGLTNDNLTSQWLQLQMNFNNLSASREQIQVQLKSVSGERDALRNQTKQMKVKADNLVNSLTKQRDALTSQTEKLKADVDHLSQNTDHLKTSLNSVYQDRDAFRNQTERLKAEVGDLSRTRDQLQASVNSLTGERDTLRNETERLKTQATDLSESKGRLQTQLNSVTQERDTLRSETEQLKTSAANTSKEMELLKIAAANVSKEMELLKTTAANTSKELELLQVQYKNVSASRDALQSEVTALKNNVQRCKPQWIPFNNKCYYFSKSGQTKSWANSKQDCVQRGGRLAKVTTREELGFISHFYDELWIGLSDIQTEGRWKWVDGTDLVGSGFWLAGEPNNAGNGEDCAHTHKKDNLSGWNDNVCSTTLSYVCEA